VQASDGYAQQSKRRITHRSGHVANLALLAFPQDDPQPGRWAMRRHRFRPFGKLGLRHDQCLAAASQLSLDLYSTGQLCQRFLRHLTLNLNQVGFRMLVIWMGQPVH
jgi:hypothetical protein